MALSHGRRWWGCETRITLSPLNPEFDPIVLEPEDEGAFRVVAEFVGVLKPHPMGSRSVR
jgi:hypothetical protein